MAWSQSCARLQAPRPNRSGFNATYSPAAGNWLLNPLDMCRYVRVLVRSLASWRSSVASSEAATTPNRRDSDIARCSRLRLTECRLSSHSWRSSRLTRRGRVLVRDGSLQQPKGDQSANRITISTGTSSSPSGSVEPIALFLPSTSPVPLSSARATFTFSCANAPSTTPTAVS